VANEEKNIQHLSIVDSIAIRNARLDASVGDIGTCFGPASVSGHTDPAGPFSHNGVGEMVFENSQLRCLAMAGGSNGIGPGAVLRKGLIYVQAITLRNTTFDCRSGASLCIGSGYADRNGTSMVGSILIEGGRISVQAESSPCIGSGRVLQRADNVPGAQSILGQLMIIGAEVQAVSGSGVGIGSGIADSECVSAIENMTISQSSFKGDRIETQNIEGDRTLIECTTHSDSNCVKANKIKIRNWLKGRTTAPSFF
jgi:hypothetical protein